MGAATPVRSQRTRLQPPCHVERKSCPEWSRTGRHKLYDCPV